MMAVSHVVAGTALWAVTAKLGGGNPADPQALAAAALGSLLPDIDHPQSWAGRKLRVISVPLSMMVGHRGVTHSLLAVLACLVILVFMGLGWGAAPIAVGYLSHLAADSLTPSGVPLLWPNRRRFTFNICQTGSVIEMGLIAVIAALGGWAAGIDLSHVKWPKI